MQELTQLDWDSLYQPHKELLVRLDLYELIQDENMTYPLRKVDEVSGVVVEGTVNEDADTDIRRTADLTMHVLDSSFVLSSNSRIWLDKFIRPYIGYPAQTTGETLWYDLGMMEMTGAHYEYDSSTQSLSLSLADMVVSLNGTKGGEVLGGDPQWAIDPTKFTEDQISIRRAVEAVLSNLGGVHLYHIDNIGPYGQEDVTTKNRIPYTMEWSRPITVYQIIKDLRDLYPGYESYFEKDGTFRLKRIPTCQNDPLAITHEQLEPLVIGESSNGLDFSGIYNVVEVVGKSYEFKDNDPNAFFTHIVTGSDANYIGKFESFEGRDAFQDNDWFSFIPNHDNTGPCTLKVNDMRALDIYMYVPGQGDKSPPPGFIKEGIPIVVKYGPDDSGRRRFEYLGRTQVKGVCILTDESPKWSVVGDTKATIKNDIVRYNTQNISYRAIQDSPFTREKIKTRTKCFAGGEYDKITTEVDAVERAEYELWKSTNLGYSMSLRTVLIPWLEVNQKIGYQSPLDELQRIELGLPIDHDEDPQYIIKKISRSLTDGTQTMEITRFYNQFPYIIGSD